MNRARANWRAILVAALLPALLPRMVASNGGRAGGSGSPPPALHLVQRAACCGFSVAVDQSNLASIVECSPGDASCTQGISICFAGGACTDVAAGSAAASVRYWKKAVVAGVPQRLDVIVGNISAHASPTAVGWSEAPGAPLP
ncbi:MAG TPA: hypothetical protein VKP58_01780 [Candidatus Acidoferrum sp.]|nr:hypothetical protein [Candidatus Acidoferrum sp.]